jgi:hypothetical protein
LSGAWHVEETPYAGDGNDRAQDEHLDGDSLAILTAHQDERAAHE